MAHVREVTAGGRVVMGRRTWDSLPDRFRPLPGRTNIVVTRQEAWQAEGALRASSLEHALEQARSHGDAVWAVGGAQIYAQSLPLADGVEVTEIHQDFVADAFAPKLGPEWRETARSPVQQSTAGGLPFSFVSYRRG